MLQLQPDVFYKMSLYEYECACDGYLIKEQKDWDKTRHLMWLLYNFNVKKGAQKNSPKDLFELDLIDPKPTSDSRTKSKEARSRALNAMKRSNINYKITQEWLKSEN